MSNCVPCLSQTVQVTAELRRPVYMCVSACAIDFRVILSLMAKVNWEVKEVIGQHSQYVDILLRVCGWRSQVWSVLRSVVVMVTAVAAFLCDFTVCFCLWARIVKLVMHYRNCRYSACGWKRLQCAFQFHRRYTSFSGKASSALPAGPLLRGEPENNFSVLRGTEI